jgi:hypothetical protein
MNQNLSKESIIDQHNLTFDAGDKANGSLYIAEPLDQSSPSKSLSAIIEKMQSVGLWSSEAVKVVPDEHRSAYKEQLELLEYVTYRDAQNGVFMITRFEHPKFPSSDERWSQWQTFLDEQYKREI